MSRICQEVDAGYAAACSDVTLCSNSKGFFKGLAEELVSMANKDWLLQLEKVDEGQKVEEVMNNKEIISALSEVLQRIQPLHRGKCARVSNERRLASAKTLLDGDYVKALALASQAVLRAPMTGEDEVMEGGVSLALALWQRSEVLLALSLHSAALEDLRLALKERLPAKMRARYYWRMGHCYRGTGEATRAKVSYELAGRLLGSDEAARALLSEDLKGLDYTAPAKHPPPNKTGISLTGGAKLNMPSLSKLLKICEEENKGRFAVAGSEISTGDVLLVDSPYAACLLSDYYGSHCLHCFKRLENCEESAPIWCPKCSGVAFCSIKCRDAAVTTYHCYECPFLDLLIGSADYTPSYNTPRCFSQSSTRPSGNQYLRMDDYCQSAWSGMSILSYIALRMVTQAGMDTSLSIHSKFISNEVKTVEGTTLNDIEGVSKKSKMKSRKERLNRSKKGLKNFAEIKEEEETKVDDKMTFEEKLELNAAQIYSLCTHWQQRKGSDCLKRVVMAMFLTECMKMAGFFNKCEPDNHTKAQNAVCELIVRNLQLLQFNAHEIYETVRGQHQFTGSKPVYIAVGIYPAGALFNHECYPAVARYFEGKKIVLRATRPLARGDVVSENYGPHFMTRGARERQRSLACRYWFRCQCPACEEDWPSMKQLQEGHVFLRCPNLSCSWKFRPNPQCLPSQCGKCATPIDRQLVNISMDTVDRCIEQYQSGARWMEAQDAASAARTLCAAVDGFHAVARAPHRDTHIAQEALRSCFAAAGNVHRLTEPEGPTASPPPHVHDASLPLTDTV